MPIVKMPDGTQVRFPDNMPKEQIKGLIASKFPDVVKAQPVAQVKAAPLEAPKGFLQKAGEFVGDTVAAAGDMALIGWNDEASAALAALPNLVTGDESYSEAYDRYLKGQRQLHDRAQKNIPARVIGQTLGLAPAMLMTAGTAPAAQVANVGAQTALKGVPATANMMRQAVAPAATTAGRIRQGAGLGGIAGTVGEAGRNEGTTNERAMAALKGGLIGTTAGGVVSGAAEAVPVLAGAAARALGLRKAPTLPQKAARRIANRAAKDGISPEAMVDRVRQARNAGADEFSLLDVGRSNVHGLARSTANTPGTGGDILRDFVTGRNAGQYNRNIRAIEDNLGPIRDPDQVRTQAAEKAMEVVGPLYNYAHKGAVKVTSDLRKVLNRPSVRDAVTRSNRLFAETGRKSPNIYGKSGEVLDDLDQIPVEQLHYVREGIDRKITKEVAIDPMFKTSREGALMLQTRQMIDNALKSGSKEMTMADEHFAALMKNSAALNKGYQYPTTRQRELEAFRSGATGGEMAMYREGAKARMGDELGGLRYGRDVSKAFLATPNQRSVIGAVAPDESKADQFASFLRAERDMSRSAYEVVGNSTTARQLAMQQQDGLAGTEKLGQTIRSGAIPMVKDTLARIVESAGDVTDAERQVIAEILTSTSEEGLEEFFQNALVQAVQNLARQRTIGPASTLGGYLGGAVQQVQE